MVTFISVQAHSAVVGSAPVTLTVEIIVDQETTLDIANDPEGAYSFQGDAKVVPGDTSVALIFDAKSVGVSGARLQGAGSSIDLQGEGKAPVTFAKSRLEFPPALVGDRDIRYADATNLSDEEVELQLVGADKGKFELLTKSLAPAGTAIPILVAFKPDAKRFFDAKIAARIDGQTLQTLDVVGEGVERLEDGFIEQTSESPSTPGEAGAQTRFSVFVPEHESHFNMGAPSPGDAGVNRVSIAGIGLTTRQKILLSATGDPEQSQAAVMAQGDVIIQSNRADVLALAEKDNIVAAHGSAYVVGDAGVFIASVAEDTTTVGSDGFPAPEVKSDGTPSTVKSAESAAIVFGSLDAFVATIGAARAVKHAYSKRWTSSMIPPVVAAIGGVAAAVCSGCSAGGVLPTTTVYGHAGVLMGTPGFGSFYALAGLVLASSFPVVLGFDTEIVGLRSAGMMGARVGISSTTETTLHSSAKVSILADGTQGEVEIDATEQATVGVTSGYSTTTKQESMLLAYPQVGYGRLELTAGRSFLDADDWFCEVKSGVTLGSKQTPDGLHIAKGTLTAEAGEALRLQVDKTKIELSPTEIAMKANTIKLETPGNTLFNFAEGTAQLSGSKILLG